MAALTTELIAAFWEHARRSSECWGWQGPRTPQGYGRIGRHYAHRVSYEIHHGPIPEGAEVLHRCDHPPCTNPDHLRVGTHAENMREMAERGRSSRGAARSALLKRVAARGERNGARLHPERVPRGERSGHARLTDEHVRAIRAAYAAGGTSWSRLARAYGVAVGTIQDVVQHRTWRHVS